MDEITLRKIATIRTCYPEKFGVPRQSGLVPSAQATLVFEPDYRRTEAVLGLEGFSHVWLVFLFDQVKAEEERLSVRPPRLGGNEKLGVFATRAPFRPNRIGLSAVRLDQVDLQDEEGPVLHLSGVDLVDGTTVLDVKPYLPYADALSEASGGFATESPQEIPVAIESSCKEAFDGLNDNFRALVIETLRLDPRPPYHGDDDSRVYHLLLKDREVSWKYKKGEIVIVSI